MGQEHEEVIRLKFEVDEPSLNQAQQKAQRPAPGAGGGAPPRPPTGGGSSVASGGGSFAGGGGSSDDQKRAARAEKDAAKATERAAREEARAQGLREQAARSAMHGLAHLGRGGGLFGWAFGASRLVSAQRAHQAAGQAAQRASSFRELAKAAARAGQVSPQRPGLSPEQMAGAEEYLNKYGDTNIRRMLQTQAAGGKLAAPGGETNYLSAIRHVAGQMGYDVGDFTKPGKQGFAFADISKSVPRPPPLPATPPPLPKGPPPLPGMLGRLGMRAGAAMANVPGGAAGGFALAQVLMMAANNLKVGSQHLIHGGVAMTRAMVHGNPVSFMQGGLGAMQGYARLAAGPIVGPLIEKAIEPLKTVVSLLGEAADVLKNYNAAIAREQGIVTAMSERFKIGFAKVLEPMLVQFGKLEQQVLGFMTDLAPVFRPLAEIGADLLKAAGGFLSSLKPLVPILKVVVEYFAMLAKALILLVQSTPLGMLAGGGGGGKPGGSSSSNWSTGAALFGPVGALGGWLMDRKEKQDDIDKADRQRSLDARAAGLSAMGFASNFHALAGTRQSFGQGMKVGVDATAGRMANAAMNATNQLNALLGITPNTNAGTGKGAPPPRPGAGAAPAHPVPTAPPTRTSHLPMPHLPSIQQTVNFNLKQKIQNERAVQEAIMQVREKLLDGFATARNESQLTAAMMMGGIEASL
jgi:hypothetical protein